MALHPMKRIGIENRAKIIEFMRAHLGANYKDIARGTGLTVGCVRDHVLQIKAEWRAKHGRDAWAVEREGVQGMVRHEGSLSKPRQLSMEELWGARD